MCSLQPVRKDQISLVEYQTD